MENGGKIENVVIIGGGPAGLAASIYNARANLNPLVFGGNLSLAKQLYGVESINWLRQPNAAMGEGKRLITYG